MGPGTNLPLPGTEPRVHKFESAARLALILNCVREKFKQRLVLEPVFAVPTAPFTSIEYSVMACAVRQRCRGAVLLRLWWTLPQFSLLERSQRANNHVGRCAVAASNLTAAAGQLVHASRSSPAEERFSPVQPSLKADDPRFVPCICKAVLFTVGSCLRFRSGAVVVGTRSPGRGREALLFYASRVCCMGFGDQLGGADAWGGDVCLCSQMDLEHETVVSEWKFVKVRRDPGRVRCATCRCGCKAARCRGSLAS